ncbi:hypothetical protein [Paractinoplanes atraurantiacus]|uniref:Formate hydrogenlyase regulatory protein HycA n=1 Tax=Paractinoplanes atraurantiacus TaxID=1036182 RepID=A0A285JJ08_9ACTN|nr:hypothetical protein [Actinoplanes atraurantiacus]SNY60255.1 formate hydrogenlyase regulatory protein HycA [Actinoplanes atraurantiacus]
MPLPAVIPMVRDEYHVQTIGTYADGQYFANVHGARRDDDEAPDRERERLYWYAYVHRFDHDGHHLGSEIVLIGKAPFLRGDLRTEADAIFARLLDGLPGASPGDIAVRPFRVRYDGVTFGLIDESDSERGAWAELYPDRLGFGEPWDGTYST